MNPLLRWSSLVAFGATLVLLSACTPSGGSGSSSTGTSATKLSGTIDIDGSSTVNPIMLGFVEEFSKEQPDVKVSVGTAGTGAGFEKFIRKEIDIANASRPIKAGEDEKLKEAGIEYVEVPIAYDGICVVVNSANTWVKSLTMDQLKAIWNKDSKISNWNQIDPSFPDKPLTLYGPTEVHGTYEYFNEVVNGEKDNTRSYSANADYNILVTGVSRDEGALGYVGYAYYESNKDKLRAVPVDGGSGPVAPSKESILNGTYTPLSRILFFYARKDSVERPEVKAFIDFALSNADSVVSAVNFVPLTAEAYTMGKQIVAEGKTGSRILDVKAGTLTLDELLKREASN